MTCPVCGGNDLKVTDVRDRDCESIYRRRKCQSCGHKFSTVEYEIELSRGGMHEQGRSSRNS